MRTYPLWQMQLARSIKAQNGIKIARWTVEKVFSSCQIVRVTEFLDTWKNKRFLTKFFKILKITQNSIIWDTSIHMLTKNITF